MTKENLKPLCHLLGGLIIIVLAFQFFEQNIINLSILYIVVGCVFLVIAGINKWLEKKIGKVSLIFFFIEAAAFYYASRTEHGEEDSIVNTSLKLVAVVYVVLGFVFLFIRDSKSKKHRSKKRRSRSSQNSVSTDRSLN